MISIKGLIRVRSGVCKRGDVVKSEYSDFERADCIIGNVISNWKCGDYEVWRKPRKSEADAKASTRKRFSAPKTSPESASSFAECCDSAKGTSFLYTTFLNENEK